MWYGLRCDGMLLSAFERMEITVLQASRFNGLGSRETTLVVTRLLVVAICVVVACTQSGDGQQLALIPTLIALGAKKFFGKDEGDPNEALAGNPAVAFVLGALTTGNAEAADDLVDSNAAVYANGYTVISPEAGNSPAQFADNVEFWHSHVPDLSIAVYDEIVEKHHHKEEDVAVRMVMSGTPHGANSAFEFVGAAFVKVVDGKAAEWRLIVDSPVAEGLIASIAIDADDK